MSEVPWRDEIVPLVRISQIIVLALAVGVVVFLALAIVLVAQGTFGPGADDLNAPAPENGEMLFVMDLTLILFLIGNMIARMIVPGLIVAQQRRKIVSGQSIPPAGPGAENLASSIERMGDAGRLMGVYQVKTIIAAALLEGTAFFAIIVFIVTQSMIGLAVAILMILGLMFHIPTRSSVIHWIEDQLAIVQQERSLRSA